MDQLNFRPRLLIPTTSFGRYPSRESTTTINNLGYKPSMALISKKIKIKKLQYIE